MLKLLCALSVLGATASWADSPTPKLDAFENDGKATEAMKKHARAVSQALGVDLDLSYLSREEYRGQFARALAQLDSPELPRALDALKDECGIAKGNTFEITTTYFNSSGTLGVDMADSRIVAHIEKAAADCGKISKTLAEMNAKMAPRKFSVPFERVFQGSIRPAELEAWKTSASKLAAAAERFEKSCGQKVDSIAFREFDQFGDGDPNPSLNIEDGPAAALKRMGRASSACDKVMPALRELARKAGVSHHILLYASPGDFFRGELSPEQALKWVKFFDEDPSRLDQLRQAVLKAAHPDDFPGIADCPAGTPESTGRKRGSMIAVRLDQRSEVRHHTVLDLFFFMLDPVLGVIAVADDVAHGPEVSLDTRAAPRLPIELKSK